MCGALTSGIPKTRELVFVLVGFSWHQEKTVALGA
jgi:hypothetical protein